ncbi:uncharacterized protein BJ171DRAFT_500758 [Polychytrium aggregatum]|uniref:uncharacterized protein n=1 Tax=Polychytrium aggregatum TaxID=110093 RepID=UPI0022FDCCBD|nr:uncharacterized protein BJ171DRAFT_500758 [Polychytrium aggregatum]KAI9205552.1 hypothetical protein BJ171DRAFT_500758 [Polychytrium aggregatum]
MANSPIPINPNNVQWFVQHSSTHHVPRCLPPGSPSSIVGSLGDVFRATNRCDCFPATATAESTCQYYGTQPGDNNVYSYSCGADPTCTQECTLIGAYPTGNFDPCTSGKATGNLTTKSVEDTSTWDPDFKTPYFYYYLESINDASCSVVSSAVRIPLYPKCTYLTGSTYAITLLHSATQMIDRYACSDPNCNSCQLVYTDTISSCHIYAAGTGSFYTKYLTGSIVKDPALVLPTVFPNQTAPSDFPPTPVSTYQPPPAPGPQAGLTSGAVAGIAVGVVAVIASVAAVLFIRLRKRTKHHRTSICVEDFDQPPPEYSQVMNSHLSLNPASNTSGVSIETPSGSEHPSYQIVPTASNPGSPFSHTHLMVKQPLPAQDYIGDHAHDNSSVSRHSYSAGTDEKSHLGSFRPDSTEPTSTSHSHGQSQTGRSELLSSRSSDSRARRYVAIASVDPKGPSDLHLRLGDVVSLKSEFQNGTAEAFNQATGMTGLVSSTSVVMLSEGIEPESQSQH